MAECWPPPVEHERQRRSHALSHLIKSLGRAVLKHLLALLLFNLREKELCVLSCPLIPVAAPPVRRRLSSIKDGGETFSFKTVSPEIPSLNFSFGCSCELAQSCQSLSRSTAKQQHSSSSNITKQQKPKCSLSHSNWKRKSTRKASSPLFFSRQLSD